MWLMYLKIVLNSSVPIHAISSFPWTTYNFHLIVYGFDALIEQYDGSIISDI